MKTAQRVRIRIVASRPAPLSLRLRPWLSRQMDELFKIRKAQRA